MLKFLLLILFCVQIASASSCWTPYCVDKVPKGAGFDAYVSMHAAPLSQSSSSSLFVEAFTAKFTSSQLAYFCQGKVGVQTVSFGMASLDDVVRVIDCDAHSFLFISSAFTSKGEDGGELVLSDQGASKCTSDSCCVQAQNLGNAYAVDNLFVMVCSGNAVSATAVSLGGDPSQAVFVNPQTTNSAYVTMLCPSSAPKAVSGFFHFTRHIPALYSSRNATMLLPSECDRGYMLTVIGGTLLAASTPKQNSNVAIVLDDN
jgi:hypothetical protein